MTDHQERVSIPVTRGKMEPKGKTTVRVTTSQEDSMSDPDDQAYPVTYTLEVRSTVHAESLEQAQKRMQQSLRIRVDGLSEDPSLATELLSGDVALKDVDVSEA